MASWISPRTNLKSVGTLSWAKVHGGNLRRRPVRCTAMTSLVRRRLVGELIREARPPTSSTHHALAWTLSRPSLEQSQDASRGDTTAPPVLCARATRQRAHTGRVDGGPQPRHRLALLQRHAQREQERDVGGPTELGESSLPGQVARLVLDLLGEPAPPADPDLPAQRFVVRRLAELHNSTHRHPPPRRPRQPAELARRP